MANTAFEKAVKSKGNPYNSFLYWKVIRQVSDEIWNRNNKQNINQHEHNINTTRQTNTGTNSKP